MAEEEIRYEVRRTPLRVDVRVYLPGFKYPIPGYAERESEDDERWVIRVFGRRGRTCTITIKRMEGEHGYEYLGRVADAVKAVILIYLSDLIVPLP